MPASQLYCPRPGYQNYEVRLFNRDVRALIKENQQHSLFSEAWADDRVTVVEARDAGEARAIASRRYPPEKGFVISGVASISRR
ncbi:MAG: hypothetical protein M0006_03940 [Magnetospirillum sp.]|nr:hypothetical protein [Magnetospirillum sp.]